MRFKRSSQEGTGDAPALRTSMISFWSSARSSERTSFASSAAVRRGAGSYRRFRPDLPPPASSARNQIQRSTDSRMHTYKEELFL